MTSRVEEPQDNPSQIADNLLTSYAIEVSYTPAMEGALAAQKEGSNYRLSIWREVKPILSGSSPT
jgi:hypothetical protein